MSDNKTPLIVIVADFDGCRHLDLDYMRDQFVRQVLNVPEDATELPLHEVIRIRLANVDDVKRIDTSEYSEVHALLVVSGILLPVIAAAAKYLHNVYEHNTLPNNFNFELVNYED